MQIHVVQAKDTLWKLSQQYKAPIPEIIKVNTLPNPEVLLLGQALAIPSPNNLHVVQVGETLTIISKQYGTTAKSLQKINHLIDPNKITPGQVLEIPTKRKRTIVTNGYIELMGSRGASIVSETGPNLTYLSPFSYEVKESGDLNPLNDVDVLSATTSKNVVPLMTITNFERERRFSPDIAHPALSDPRIQKRLFDTILDTMKKKKYRGLNIDFEYVYQRDKSLYNQFIKRAADLMHENGWIATSAVAPKYNSEQKGLQYEAHDYAFHGKVLDFVILMTYEWGYTGGPAMAISPVDQMEQVVRYALTQMPANKILLGIEFYGRDWTLPYKKGTYAETFSPGKAIERGLKYGVQIQFDSSSASPYYRYIDETGRSHEVWFEDARSLQAKYDLVKKYNLHGVSYWILDMPMPENWPILKNNFNVKKYNQKTQN